MSDEQSMRLLLTITEAGFFWLRTAEQMERERDAAYADLAAARTQVGALKQRVWKLRPALDLTVQRLREVYPSYEDYHEGGEIQRVIEIGEQALVETAGPSLEDARAALAPGEPSAAPGVLRSAVCAQHGARLCATCAGFEGGSPYAEPRTEE